MTSTSSEHGDEIEVNEEDTIESTQAGSRSRIGSKRRKSTSKVWDDFDRYIDPEGKDVAKCRYCKVKMAAGGNNGTSHLKKHIDLLRCPVLRNDPSRAKKLTPKVTSFQFDQERSREDLVKLISKHNLPFNMCEYEFFEYFCNNLNPEFKLMSRNTARADIMNVYTEEKQKLYDLFDRLSSKVSLTTDLWTSEYQSYAYVCVTAHYITDDWVLKKKIIAYRQIEFPHEGPRLFEVLKEIILDWNLDRKIMSIVVDNAKNNDVQTRLMREWMSNSNALPLGGELLHVRCSAHILNLVVQDGMSLLVGMISKIRASVRYLRKSAFAMQKFEVALAHEKLEHKRKIAMDMPIRWNSTYEWYESSRGSAANAGRKSELDDYLDEAVFPGYEGFDILDWWKVNSAKLPTLAKIARDLLAVPATTSASEGAFSIGGRLLDETRTCLLPEVVEALMCTHDWIEGRRNNNRGASSSTT